MKGNRSFLEIPMKIKAGQWDVMLLWLELDAVIDFSECDLSRIANPWT